MIVVDAERLLLRCVHLLMLARAARKTALWHRLADRARGCVAHAQLLMHMHATAAVPIVCSLMTNPLSR